MSKWKKAGEIKDFSEGYQWQVDIEGRPIAIFKFGEIMAKKAKKAAKKAVKKVVEVLKPPAPKPEVPKESTIRKHLEELHLLRRDAAVIWEEIQDKDLTDEDIRELVRSKNFGTLLGEIS